MTEITQADRDAAAQYDVVEAFARHRQYGYDQGYYDGRKMDGAEERAKIVAWLMREQEEYPSTEYSGFAAMMREEIEAGEHLKCATYT